MPTKQKLQCKWIRLPNKSGLLSQSSCPAQAQSLAVLFSKNQFMPGSVANKIPTMLCCTIKRHYYIVFSIVLCADAEIFLISFPQLVFTLSHLRDSVRNAYSSKKNIKMEVQIYAPSTVCIVERGIKIIHYNKSIKKKIKMCKTIVQYHIKMYETNKIIFAQIKLTEKILPRFICSYF